MDDLDDFETVRQRFRLSPRSGVRPRLIGIFYATLVLAALGFFHLPWAHMTERYWWRGGEQHTGYSQSGFQAACGLRTREYVRTPSDPNPTNGSDRETYDRDEVLILFHAFLLISFANRLWSGAAFCVLILNLCLGTPLEQAMRPATTGGFTRVAEGMNPRFGPELRSERTVWFWATFAATFGAVCLAAKDAQMRRRTRSDLRRSVSERVDDPCRIPDSPGTESRSHAITRPESAIASETESEVRPRQ